MFSKQGSLLLLVSFLILSTVTAVGASGGSGSLVSSLQAWLGQPADRTTLTVNHTRSGVVLRLTSSDTATVHQLHAALPEQTQTMGRMVESRGGTRIQLDRSYSHSHRSRDRYRELREDSRYENHTEREGEEEGSGDEEDHEES